jgi:hypothetical protein
MPPIDQDLPAEDQDGGSAPPTDADGAPVQDDQGPITVPDPNDPEDDSVEMQEDGSAVIKLEGSLTEVSEPTEFFSNLADGVVDHVLLNRRALKFIEMIERDMQARKERDDQYAEGIKRTGMGGEAPGGADFEGASKVVHPVLAEGCIDFSAKAMKEIFPPSGPCRTKIIGKSTPEKLDKAERKRQYMNWQLTEQIAEYRGQTKKTLTQLPLGGSQYKNWWYDKELGRSCVEFVPIDYVILPAGAQDFYSAQRITHIQDITEQTYLRRVDSGFYRDADNMQSSTIPDPTASQKASEKVEGVRPDPYNQDGLRRVYVVNSAFDAFDEDDLTHGDPAPYIWHIDNTTHQVLALYRNWDPEDDRQERLHWLVDYTFIHWRGPQGVGLLHLIGSLAGAITGGIRSVLDNALVQNSLSGVKLKGGKTSGTTEQPAVGEVVELEGPTAGTVDDIRKLFMAYPFNPTSPVLYNVVQWLVDQARGVVSVASEKLADGKTDMPVGSTLALIEQGSSIFSDIHSGLHHSQAQELKILHRLNKWYIEDRETIAELGDLVVEREDFQGPCDIIPVSDPLIFSETQRYAQVQAMHALAGNPVFADKIQIDNLLERTVDLLHIPDPDKLIKVQPQPEDLDPVSENQVVAMGEQPIKAFAFQDHMAHLLVHLHFITSPMFGANPLIGPKFVPQLLNHCVEHMILQYVNHSVAAAASGEVAGMQAQSPDDRFAVTMPAVDYMMSNNFQQLGAMFQKAIQLAQQYQQQLSQPPMDPTSSVNLKIGMAEVERKKAQDAASNKLDSDKLQSTHAQEMARISSQQQIDQSREQARNSLDAMIQGQKDQRVQDELRSKEAMEQQRLYNEQVIEQMRQEGEAHRVHLKGIMDTVGQHLAPLGQLPEKMAAGGSVGQDTTPPMPPQIIMQQDPEHTQALAKLGAALQSLPTAQGAAFDKHANDQRQAITELIGMIVQGQNDMGARISQGLMQMGQVLSTGLTAAVQEMARSGAQTAEAVSAIKGVAQELGDNYGDHASAMTGAIDKLHRTMASPRIRELRKDKAGNKTAVDRLARDGEA